MHRRPLRRATVLALAAALVVAGTAFADQLLADGDVVNGGIQGTKALGTFAPGAEVTTDVEFTLTCIGLGHVDLGQTVNIGWSGVGSVPTGGAIVSVTPATIGPIGDGWAADTQGCPDPTPSLLGTTRSHVTLRAPTVAGSNYMYTIMFDRTLSPAGNADGSAFTRTATQVSFSLNVASNSSPSLTVPAAGVQLGTTTISCTVHDSVGATTNGGFEVTVVDTTAPTLSGLPSDIHVTTGEPGGAAVSYSSPTATDVVDPSPTVGCLPASGSTFPVGTTSVVCVATDASGNARKGSFDVQVSYVAPHSASATWLEPVGNGGTFAANHSRTIPVKVRLFVDGVERSSGEARLALTPCGGGSVAQSMPLVSSGGRWNASLDTSTLAGPCYTVTAWIDGLAAGSFRLELGDTTASLRQASKPSVSAAPPKNTPKGR